MTLRIFGATAFLATLALAADAPTDTDRFREANQLARSADPLRAIAIYRSLAASGSESASLYWNWAQVAAGRNARGEALWALMRGRELDPGDRAIAREIEKLRESLNLDAAEIAPEPLSAPARGARRFHLDVLAAALLGLSVASHVVLRLLPSARRLTGLTWAFLVLGLAFAAAPIAGSFARSTAVVVRYGAPMLDAASPTAETQGLLREGEVVPVLEASGEWLRVEDSSGARGWTHAADVRRLDIPPTEEAVGR